MAQRSAPRRAEDTSSTTMGRTSRRTSTRSAASGSRLWSSPSWRRMRPPSRTGPGTRAGQK
eukprot:5746966-Pyramimonas_sp.AAC.1